MQVEEQPSPLTVFASSHLKQPTPHVNATFLPSPQISTHVETPVPT